VQVNMEKTKVVRISRQPSPLQIMINQRQPENVKYSIYLGNMITDDARCTCEIQSGIDMARAAFNKMETLFVRKLNLKLKEEITLYIWSIYMCGVEI